MNAKDGQHSIRATDAETATETGNATGVEADRLGLFARIGNGLLWLVGHAPKILPVVVISLIAPCRGMRCAPFTRARCGSRFTVSTRSG